MRTSHLSRSQRMIFTVTSCSTCLIDEGESTSRRIDYTIALGNVWLFDVHVESLLWLSLVCMRICMLCVDC